MLKDIEFQFQHNFFNGRSDFDYGIRHKNDSIISISEMNFFTKSDFVDYIKEEKITLGKFVCFLAVNCETANKHHAYRLFENAVIRLRR